MRGFGVLALAACGWAAGADRMFEVAGQGIPEAQGAVSLFGATNPFTTATLTDSRGKFRFTRLEAGQYTVAAFIPGYGEKRLTIDVRASSTDAGGGFGGRLRLGHG